MPKVSFVLPAYKRRFLYEAIASILAQTYHDFELVVVDDCSPENLKEVVDEFNDERISYHKNEVNLGGKNLVSAWTKAMAYAQGEWCVLAGDDDVYDREYLEEMMRLVEKYPNVDLFHSRAGVINDKGELIMVGEPRVEYETGVELLYNRGYRRFQQTMPDFMFRRSKYFEIGGFVDFPLATYSDDATWMLMAKEHGAVCSPRMLYYFRASGINLSCVKTGIKEKVIAHEEFRSWVKRFISTLSPQNDSDEVLLNTLKRAIDIPIDQLTMDDMGNASLLEWMRILVHTSFGVKLKAKCVRERVLRALKLR